MLPIAIVAAVLAVALYVLGYFYSVASLPIQKLHKLLHDEGQSVLHATQFIIYFLSWSFVFGSYALLTFFMIALTALYSLFSILTYVCTLGGFKFHVFAGVEDIAVEVNGSYASWIPLAYIAVIAVLLIVLPLIKAISAYADYPLNSFQLFLQLFKAQIIGMRSWRILFSIIYSAAVFAPNPKK